MIKNVLKNSAWMLSYQLLNYLISFVVGIYIIRYLGPTQYGILIFIITIVSIFNPIILLGTSNIIPREVETNSQRFILHSFLKLSLIISTVLAIFLMIFSYFTSFDFSYLLLIYSIGLFFQPFQIISYHNNSLYLSKRNTFSLLISSLIVLIVKVSVIYFDMGLKYVVLSYLLDSILYSAFLIYFCKEIKISKVLFSEIKNIFYLKKSIVYNVSSTLIFILYTRIDQLMIKYFLGNEDLGLYGSSVKFYDAYVMLGFTLSLSFLTYITKNKDSINFFRNLYKYFYLIFITGTIILCLISEYIILLLLGDNYIDSLTSLIILFLAAFFAILTSLNNRVLISKNLELIIFRRSVVTLFIIIGLNLVLIPSYGIEGAAISTLITTFFASFIYDFLDKKSSFLNQYKFFIK